MAKRVHKLVMLLPQEVIESMEKEELQWEPTGEWYGKGVMEVGLVYWMTRGCEHGRRMLLPPPAQKPRQPPPYLTPVDTV